MNEEGDAGEGGSATVTVWGDETGAGAAADEVAEEPAAPPKRTVAEIAASCANVVRLIGPETPHIEVLLVGTAHISYASVLQVQEVHFSPCEHACLPCGCMQCKST